jgi:hypothetical protein
MRQNEAMGLFDTIRCEYPLPDARHQDLEFQTKDLECFLAHYRITRDGRLVFEARGGKEPDRDIEWPVHRDISIYTFIETSGDREWVEYVVRFTHDRVEWIRPLAEIPPLPQLPPLELNWDLPIFSKRVKAEAEPQDSTPPDTPPAETGDADVPDPEEVP